MTTQENEKARNLLALKEKVAELTAEIERLELAPVARWRAEKGGAYWCIRANGDIEQFDDDYWEMDNYPYATGNYHKTKQMTEVFSKKTLALRKVKDKILELNQGWEPNWEDSEEPRWFIVYEHDDRSFESVCRKSHQYQDKELACKSFLLAQELQASFTVEELKLAYGI